MPRRSGSSSTPRARGTAAKGRLSMTPTTAVGRLKARAKPLPAQAQSRPSAPAVSPITGRRLATPSAAQAAKSRSILGKYR
jgi:hypothetical protein